MDAVEREQLNERLQELWARMMHLARNHRRRALFWAPKHREEHFPRVEATLDREASRLRELATQYVDLALEHPATGDWQGWIAYNRAKIRVDRDGLPVEMDPHDLVIGAVVSVLTERGIRVADPDDWFTAMTDPDAWPKLTDAEQAERERQRIAYHALEEYKRHQYPGWFRPALSDDERRAAWDKYSPEQRRSVWLQYGLRDAVHPQREPAATRPNPTPPPA